MLGAFVAPCRYPIEVTVLRLRSSFALAGLVASGACARPAVTPATTAPADESIVAIVPRPAPAVPTYTIEQFLGTTTLNGASWSPDQRRILVSSDQTGVFNAFAIPVDGSAPVQLTSSTTDAVMVHRYFPNDERFLYSADQGGNELHHVYVREIDGTVRDLTPGTKLKASYVGFAADDRSFFVLTNERDNRYFDLHEYAADGYARTVLYQDSTGMSVEAVSPDRRWLALVRTGTTSDNDVFVHDRKTGKTTHITPHTGDVSSSPQTFSPDGRHLYLTTDEGHEFQYLVRHDLETGKRTVVHKPGWDVTGAGLSESGRHLVVAINNDARTEVQILDAETLRPIPMRGLPNGDITSIRFSPDEKQLAFYVSGSRSPRDLHVHDIASGSSKQLSRTLNAAIDPAHLVEAEVVRFKSYDGLEVPGILYKPHGASASSKAPALVWVHGGPGGQSRAGYSALIQYLVNHGYVVYAINNRGSSGYGKTFYTLDDRKHGDADLGDCIASKGMLIGTGYVDPAKIGIVGGSYGGYMVLAALTFRPDEFAAGVDIFGVANWVRTLESIPPWWEAQRQALYKELGDPGVDGAYLRKISPLFHAGNITKPLLVLQGANDPRVLKVESDEIVAAARQNGAPVEYVVFPDEGHGFAKKENQLRANRTILAFLDQHLKGMAPATIQ